MLSLYAVFGLYQVEYNICHVLLRAHPVLCAYLRRANQDTDLAYQANTTAFPRADQIQNSLALLGRDLGLPNLGLGDPGPPGIRRNKTR